MKKVFLFLITFVVLIVLSPKIVSAHEAYVLTQQEFQQGSSVITTNPLAPLLTPEYFQISSFITFCVVLAYLLVILWSLTPWAKVADGIIKKAHGIGPLIIRLAVSSSFFFAAQANCFLGPELSLASIPGGQILRFLAYVIAIMVFLGFFTEIVAALALGIFLYSSYFFGAYMMTYANYFGEFLILMLFGSRFVSLDQLLFGNKLLFTKLKKYTSLETPIVRILYGFGLIYAGYNIKFVHQILTIWVYNQYHLQDFFHASAGFIAAGAGLSEILIGFFIMIGFAMRFTILISLVFITLSLIYFHELLWPHIILYGISFSLLINSGDFLTIDHYIKPLMRKLIGKK